MAEVETNAPIEASIDLTPAAERAYLLLELSREITSSLDLQDVLDQTFTSLRKLVSFGGGSIQMIENDALIPVATDPPMSEEAKQVRIPLGQGISGRIAASGEPIYIPDIWIDPRVQRPMYKGVSTGVRSYFGVPLILQGHPVGVLQIDSPIVDAFDADARALMLAFVPTIAAAVQNAQLFERERDALERLQETEQLQRDFLAVVSHELRTPLTSVSGFGLTLAQHAFSLDSQTIADMGQRIWRASRRLERVMGDLLDLSRIERGTLSCEPVPTDIEPIIRAGVVEQSHMEHPIELDMAPSLPHAMIDGERLHQILGNLLSNARKFSPPGSTINVSARDAGSAIEMTVSDHGRGIPAAAMHRVFDRFFQAEPAATRSADGLGIGLYLVKQLCDHMDATIELHSVEGQGTSCIIRIPTTA